MYRVHFTHYLSEGGERGKRPKLRESIFTKYYLHPCYVNTKATEKYLVEVEIEASDKEQNWREQTQFL